MVPVYENVRDLNNQLQTITDRLKKSEPANAGFLARTWEAFSRGQVELGLVIRTLNPYVDLIQSNDDLKKSAFELTKEVIRVYPDSPQRKVALQILLNCQIKPEKVDVNKYLFSVYSTALIKFSSPLYNLNSINYELNIDVDVDKKTNKLINSVYLIIEKKMLKFRSDLNGS